jgi:hypothetical protein
VLLKLASGVDDGKIGNEKDKIIGRCLEAFRMPP